MIDGIYKPRVSNIEDLDNPTILQTLEAMKKYVVEHAVPGEPGKNGADGAPGQDGADGAAATIQIGEVVTGAAGTNAIVENTGTENAAILKFTIPRGATGTPGTNGQDGAPGADGKNGVTFKPSVDTNGDLSWSNDGGLPNPETVNVRGAQGEAATIQVGEVTTGAAGTQASVRNSGTTSAAVLDFTIPQGADGTNGAAATVQVGQVTTLPAGSQATVTNSGTNQAAVLNFGIPTGATGANGAAATIQIGKTTTGLAGTNARVENTGTENAAVLDFTIPRGVDGLSALECGEIVEQNKAPFDGMAILLTTLNRSPIQNEKIEFTYRDTSSGKIYGVLGNFPNSGTASYAYVSVVDFWQISGENGAGVPAGGITGQVLKKKSGADYDTEWANESGGGGGGGGVEVVDLGTPTFQAASSGLKATVTLTSEQAAKLAAEPAPIVKFTLSGQGASYQNGVYYVNKSFKMGVAVQIYTLALLYNGSMGWTVSVQAMSSQALIAITPYTLPSN